MSGPKAGEVDGGSNENGPIARAMLPSVARVRVHSGAWRASAGTRRGTAAEITEIAPDSFRILLFASEHNLQFNHFLIRDDQPTLFHTGVRMMFRDLQAAVPEAIPPAKRR